MDINHSTKIAILYVSMDTEKLMNIADNVIASSTPIVIVSAKSDVEIVRQMIGFELNTKVTMELGQRISKLEKASIYLACGVTSEEEMRGHIHAMIEKYPIQKVYVDEMVLKNK